jgi:hypothetical protein
MIFHQLQLTKLFETILRNIIINTHRLQCKVPDVNKYRAATFTSDHRPVHS